MMPMLFRSSSPKSFVRATVVALAVWITVPAMAQTTQPAAPLKSADRAFRYGVCAHLNRYKGPAYDKLIDAVDRLGVDVVRDSVDWNNIEPTEGTWTFDAMDRIVNDTAARGVEVQALLAFSTQWASTGDPKAKDWNDWNKVAPRVGPFANYARTMVKRYKNRVRFWEIWNEQDISFWKSTTAQYTELFNATSAAIAETDPSAKVLNGGFALNKRPPNPNFIQDFLPAANATHWNVWAYHDYHTFAQMIAREKENRQLYNSKKLSIPIWINEGGFHTLLPGGEQEQAITLAKKLAVAPSLGIGAYIWYDLIDDGDKPLDPEHHFGLLRTDYSPKPAFVAYQNTIRELAPRTFEKRLPDSNELPGLWGFVYKAPAADGENVLVLWREGKGRQTPVWIGAKDGGSATSVKAMDGKTIDAGRLDGGLLVTVSDEPVYVRLRGTTEPTIRPVLSLPDKLAVLPGRANTLRFTVSNPTPHDATFAVAVTADSPAVAVKAEKADVKLAAGQSATLTAEARVAAGAAVPAKGVVTVALRPGGNGAALDARLPYVVASALPKLASPTASMIPTGQGLVNKLVTADSIVNLFSAEPNDKMHWHGPTDLSVTSRLAYTADALLLEVVATDDTHKQDDTAADIWEGDSLQFAVRTDDGRPQYLEAGLALGGDGKPHGWIYALPTNVPMALGQMESPVGFDVKREGTQTRYTVRMPWKSLGIDGPPPSGLRLNFLVNDNDGLGRKGWVQLSDGIGREKNPNMFTLFVGDDAGVGATR